MRLVECAGSVERGSGAEPRVDQEAIEDSSLGIDIIDIRGQKHRRLRLTHRQNGIRTQTVDRTLADQTSDLGEDVVGEGVSRVV